MSSFRLLAVLSAAIGSFAFASSEVSENINQGLPTKPPSMERYEKLLKIEDLSPKTSEVGDSSQKVYVKGFKAVGNSVVSHKTIEKLLLPYAQKHLSITELYEAAAVITKYYRDRKYFVARAYIPKQEMKDDVVIISILEGAYGEIAIDNDSRISGEKVYKVATILKNSKVISSDDMERSLLILNSMSGAKVASAVIREGKNAGESDFYITLKKTPLVSGYAVYDNYGNEYIGKNRFGIEANIKSPTNSGDKAEIGGLVSQGGLVKNYSARYSLPIGGDGLSAGCDFSSVTYKLSGDYSSLDSTGETKTSAVWISYPIIKKEAMELSVTAGIADKRMKDEIKTVNTSISKNSHSAYISSSFNRFWEYTEFGVDMSASVGKLYFKDELSLENDKRGADTAGAYGRVNVGARLSVKTSSNSNITFGAKAQKAMFRKNLDGAEDFSIAGVSGVRAYPSGEYSAENGYLLSISHSYRPLFLGSINGAFGLFADYGRGYVEKNIAMTQAKALSDIGASFSAYAYGAFLKLEVAKILGRERIVSERHIDTRALLQAGYEF